jgi:hypothetical protein
MSAALFPSVFIREVDVLRKIERLCAQFDLPERRIMSNQHLPGRDGASEQ